MIIRIFFLNETSTGDRFFVLLRALLDQEFVALYLVGSEKLPEILKRQGERDVKASAIARPVSDWQSRSSLGHTGPWASRGVSGPVGVA